MEIQGCKNINLDPEYPAGRDDDNNLLDNRVDLTTCELAECLEAQKDVDLCIDDNDLLSELHESSKEARKQTKGKYNMRKSLAWDSAFFTSAGVLDADELSNIITGAEKGKKDLLPGIQEDVTASTESVSTFESDHLNLEILEEELFVDIRASIQRSNKKAPRMKTSCGKPADMEIDSAPISSLKNDGVACSSQSKNSKPGLKKTSIMEHATMSKSPFLTKKGIGNLGLRKPIKQDTCCSQVTSALENVVVSKSPAKQNVGKQGSRKPSKQDTGPSQITQIGAKNPTLKKAPKTLRNSTSASIATAKQDSVGIDREKSETGSTNLGVPAATTSKGAQAPKASVSVGRMLPRPAVSSKSSLLTTTTVRVQSTRSSISNNNSNGLFSGAPSKSLTGRRNPGGSSNAVTGPSSSIPKSLARHAFRNKPTPSTLSPCVRPKVSASVSPSSSISEWSSVSSSSSSMVIQKFNNTRASIDTSSSRSTDANAMLLHSRSLSRDQTSGGNQNQEVNLSSNIPKKPSAVGNTGTSMRPSGLRLPSPKIGFFDGVKSSPRTPNGHKPSQSGLRTVIPRNGAAAKSPSQMSSGKLTSTKAPITRMLSKPGHPKVASLTSSQEKSRASINSSSASLDVEDSPSLSPEVKVNATIQAESPKSEKAQVDDGVKHVVDAGPVSIDKGDLSNLNAHDFMVIEDIEASVEINKVTGLEGVSQNDVSFIQNVVEKQAVDADKLSTDKGAVCDMNTHDFMVVEGIKASVKVSDVSGLEGVDEKDVGLIEKGAEKQAVKACTMAMEKGTSGDSTTHNFMVAGDIKSSVESSDVSSLEGVGDKGLLLIQNDVEKQSVDAHMVAIDNQNLGGSNIQDAMMIGDLQASVESNKIACLENKGQRDMLLIQNGAENQAADGGILDIDRADLADLNMHNVLIEDSQASVDRSKVEDVEGDGQKNVLLIQNGAQKQAIDNGNIGDCTTHNFMVPGNIDASVENSDVSSLERVGDKSLLLIQNGVEKQYIDASTVAIDKETLGDSNMNDVLMIGDFRASAESSKATGFEGDCRKDVLLIQNGLVKQLVDAAAGTVDIVNFGDSNIHDVMMIGDFQASVKNSIVSVVECITEKDGMANQSALKDNSPQSCDAAGKENVKCQGKEGIKGCRNFQSPKNELFCNEHDTTRSPLALVNQVFIVGSGELDALIGDTTSERELE